MPTSHGEFAAGTAAEASPLLAAECAGLARKVRERGARTLGLAPAGKEVTVAPVAVHLARALAATATRAVAVVTVQPRSGGASAGPSALVTTSLGGGVVLVTPVPGRLDLGAILATLEDRSRQYERQVVDLTGLARIGEEPVISEALDALLVVARSGRTRVGQLHRRLRDLPRDRVAGVLLTGV